MIEVRVARNAPCFTITLGSVLHHGQHHSIRERVRVRVRVGVSVRVTVRVRSSFST